MEYHPVTQSTISPSHPLKRVGVFGANCMTMLCLGYDAARVVMP